MKYEVYIYGSPEIKDEKELREFIKESIDKHLKPMNAGNTIENGDENLKESVSMLRDNYYKRMDAGIKKLEGADIGEIVDITGDKFLKVVKLPEDIKSFNKELNLKCEMVITREFIYSTSTDKEKHIKEMRKNGYSYGISKLIPCTELEDVIKTYPNITFYREKNVTDYNEEYYAHLVVYRKVVAVDSDMVEKYL